MSDPKPIEMLRDDHREVEQLFSDFEATDQENHEERKSIAKKICKKLDVHAKLEEELFYPKVREASSEGEKMISESLREHNEMKDLIEQIDTMEPDNFNYEQKMTALKDATLHHVREEEAKVFPFATRHLEDELGAGFRAKMLAYKGKNLTKRTIEDFT
jgi:hemerythrin superfamily protein